jgi:methionyl-tRNA synthetase
MSAPGAYYITTPIYYVNDVPHIGHAYTTLACDVLARFQRLDGKRVLFMTGTDEHGNKVEKTAQEQGLSPQELCDRVSGRFRALVETMDFAIDDFIRTTQPRHEAAVQALWRAMHDNGALYLGSYAGWYAVRDESYYAESELTKGPDGGFLAPSGAPVEWVEEPSYFFKLSAYTDKLLAHYEDNPDFILPASRRNEVVSFVRQGLRDLSISRTSFSWGIPVPGDEKHIMYVWLDALTNYITAAGYPDESGQEFRKYWPADLHVIGKDILRFHAVYWPAFLMSAGLALPKRVFAHGFLNIEGEKMSKSLGNVMAPGALVGEFGLDQIRYFLMREVPYGNDGSFSREAMINRINSDLANDLGNLCQRVLSMIGRNCGGAVPEPGALSGEDETLLTQGADLIGRVRDAFEMQQYHNALAAIWEVVGAANRYVDAQAPWALRKSDPARMATVLYVLAETIRRLGILVQPVMPRSGAKILDLLAVASDARDFAALPHRLAPKTALPKPEAVFPRYIEPDTK